MMVLQQSQSSSRWGWRMVTSVMAAAVVVVVVVMPQPGRALYTFSCEGHLMTLHCPYGQVIYVRSAMFGKKPGSLNRCGETERIHRSCMHDTTQFMKFKCEGKDYCQVNIELATFNLENLCPTFIKYAEVHFDCVSPHSVRHAKQCCDRCLPPAPPPPVYGMSGGRTPGAMGGNAVLAGPAPGQSGVVYTHQGGTPIHAPVAPSPSASSSSSPGAAGKSGVVYTHQGGAPAQGPPPSPSSASSSPAAPGAAADPHAKGFGVPPANNPQPSGQGAAAATISRGVIDVVRNHMRPAQQTGGSPSVPRQMLMAKLSQMIGAMRRGRRG